MTHEPLSENEMAAAWSGYPDESIEVWTDTGQMIYPPTDNPPPEEDSELSLIEKARALANSVAKRGVAGPAEHLALAQVYALLALADRLVEVDTGIRKYLARDGGGADRDD